LKKKIIAIIPARFNSSRFPGKPLVDIKGKSMIQRVYENVKDSNLIDQVVVATDDMRIGEAVKAFKGEYILTSSSHVNGTSRIAEAAERVDADIIINVQGDEPLVEAEILDELIKPFLTTENTVMATLKAKLTEENLINDPNVVKVITDVNGNAVYFSRSVIPFNRDGVSQTYYKHIGIYAYSKDFLLKYVTLPPSDLELAESLEQLRALENGYPIYVSEVENELISIDTPEDLDRLERYMKERSLN